MARPRLLELLRSSSDCKITLISAPAGYGKTTLLAQWSQAEEATLPFAWVSLDEQDNDQTRLWRHIVEALRRATPQADFASDVLVGVSVAGQRLVEASLPMLINALAGLPHRVVVVLDDYQLVTEDDCHASIKFFVDHISENVHFVIASRTDPPLPLGRWRARGEMKEIRSGQLAFSGEEAAVLLAEKMGLGIGPDDLSLLLERTEGWPAGIYLAALSLQGREDKRDLIASFEGSNRYIVDLLAEEVMGSLSEEVKEFLLMTSVLNRLTASLCNAVVDREGSGTLLRELAHRNLFVIPLDERGEWYRYHHLFSQYLFYELNSSRPGMVPVLHRRASAWSESEGFFDSAIRHAVEGADHERAGMLVARHWYEYILVGQTKTVEHWLECLPEELTTREALILLVRAWICTLSGRGDEGERLLGLVENIKYEGPLLDGTPSIEAGVVNLRAVFGLGGVRSTLETARRAVALDEDQPTPFTPLIRFALGSSLYLSGERSLARRQFEAAIEWAGANQPMLRMVSLSYLSIVATDEGQLEEAESHAREALALVTRFGLQELPQASWAPIALGYALAGRRDLDEAQIELENGLSPRRKLPGLSPWPTLIGLRALAAVCTARGDRSRARDVLAEARTILEKHPDAGIFPELLERQERKLSASKRRDRSLDGKLTARELEVLELLAGELSGRQIAQSLYVAPSTVRTQVKSIYRKLEVSSRGEAVKEASARGLI
jgi:LuxR family transcriptional regulator, maltose regulon positive regulatory protein